MILFQTTIAIPERRLFAAAVAMYTRIVSTPIVYAGRVFIEILSQRVNGTEQVTQI